LGNLIKPQFSKIKKTQDKNVCPIVADLVVTKRGRNEKVGKENSHQKKMKEMVQEKGKWKNRKQLCM